MHPRPAVRSGMGARRRAAALLIAADAAAAQFATFDWRCRVKDAASGDSFSCTLGSDVNSSASMNGSAWSQWAQFTAKDATGLAGNYPNNYLGGWPVLRAGVTLKPATPRASSAARYTFDVQASNGTQTLNLAGSVFPGGGNLGVMVARAAHPEEPFLQTLAEFNRRYWAELEGLPPLPKPPRSFPIVNIFRGNDGNHDTYADGVKYLAAAGSTAVGFGDSPPGFPGAKELLESAGLKTAGGAGWPPGYAFDDGLGNTTAEVTANLDKWAQAQAKTFTDYGIGADQVVSYAIADEPNWDETKNRSIANPRIAARWRDWLESKATLYGLKPADFGAPAWGDVEPLGRGSPLWEAPELRRRFVWTTRFISHNSAVYYGEVTAAMERAFYRGVPTHVNWNTFAGRMYTPTGENGGSASNDWFDFGRARGGTRLWTEDWFPDYSAHQWAYYAARMRGASSLADDPLVSFGAYIVPRPGYAVPHDDMWEFKVGALLANGAKTLRYFEFGPEYSFPQNCFSENTGMLAKMREVHGLIGEAEELLLPATRPRAGVAILYPRSSFCWDPNSGIQDATNTQVVRHTMDHVVQAYGLFLMLQTRANIPVDFIDEEGCVDGSALKGRRAVLITEPNIPAACLHALVAWAKAGGTLITSSYAGLFDDNNDNVTILGDASGIYDNGGRESQGQHRMELGVLYSKGNATGALGEFMTFGPNVYRLPKAVPAAATVVAHYTTTRPGTDPCDGCPAVIHAPVGEGKHVHFANNPMNQYYGPSMGWWRPNKEADPVSGAGQISAYVTGWKYVVAPILDAGVVPPVLIEHPATPVEWPRLPAQFNIEGSLLTTDAGAVVVLLNWDHWDEKRNYTGLHVSVSVPFSVARCRSARLGDVPCSAAAAGGTGANLTIATLRNVDIVMLYKKKAAGEA